MKCKAKLLPILNPCLPSLKKHTIDSALSELPEGSALTWWEVAGAGGAGTVLWGAQVRPHPAISCVTWVSDDGLRASVSWTGKRWWKPGKVNYNSKGFPPVPRVYQTLCECVLKQKWFLFVLNVNTYIFHSFAF